MSEDARPMILEEPEENMPRFSDYADNRRFLGKKRAGTYRQYESTFRKPTGQIDDAYDEEEAFPILQMINQHEDLLNEFKLDYEKMKEMNKTLTQRAYLDDLVSRDDLTVETATAILNSLTKALDTVKGPNIKTFRAGKTFETTIWFRFRGPLKYFTNNEFYLRLVSILSIQLKEQNELSAGTSGGSLLPIINGRTGLVRVWNIGEISMYEAKRFSLIGLQRINLNPSYKQVVGTDGKFENHDPLQAPGEDAKTHSFVIGGICVYTLRGKTYYLLLPLNVDGNVDTFARCAISENLTRDIVFDATAKTWTVTSSLSTVFVGGKDSKEKFAMGESITSLPYTGKGAYETKGKRKTEPRDGYYFELSGVAPKSTQTDIYFGDNPPPVVQGKIDISVDFERVIDYVYGRDGLVQFIGLNYWNFGNADILLRGIAVLRAKNTETLNRQLGKLYTRCRLWNFGKYMYELPYLAKIYRKWASFMNSIKKWGTKRWSVKSIIKLWKKSLEFTEYARFFTERLMPYEIIEDLSYTYSKLNCPMMAAFLRLDFEEVCAVIQELFKVFHGDLDASSRASLDTVVDQLHGYGYATLPGFYTDQYVKEDVTEMSQDNLQKLRRAYDEYLEFKERVESGATEITNDNLRTLLDQLHRILRQRLDDAEEAGEKIRLTKKNAAEHTRDEFDRIMMELKFGQSNAESEITSINRDIEALNDFGLKKISQSDLLNRLTNITRPLLKGMFDEGQDLANKLQGGESFIKFLPAKKQKKKKWMRFGGRLGSSSKPSSRTLSEAGGPDTYASSRLSNRGSSARQRKIAVSK